MRVILGGGDRTSYRSVLVKNNVPSIAINLSELKVPSKKEFLLSEQFGGAQLWLYTSPTDTDVERYDSFIRANEHDLTGIVGRPDYNGEWLGAKYFPSWNDPKDTERLAHLMEKHGRVAIGDKSVTPKTLPRIRQLQQRWGARLIGITSKQDIIEALPWDAVIVTSWTSAVRYHETQVWDGHGLRRYPASNKVAARKQHRADIIKLGCNYDEVIEDDVDECAKLAVLSWLEWERKTFGAPKDAYDPDSDPSDGEVKGAIRDMVATILSDSGDSEFEDSTGMSVAIRPSDTRHESERILPPLITTEIVIPTGENGSQDGETEHVPVEVLRTTGVNMRMCDSCYLSQQCPKFKPNASCAFNFPVELRTKEQLLAAVTALITLQMDRAQMEIIGEQITGQGASPTTGKEIDRFMSMVAQLKEIQDTRDFIKLSVESKGRPGGAMDRLAALFPKITEVQSQLPTPMATRELDAFLAPIVDAHVVEDLEQVPVSR